MKFLFCDIQLIRNLFINSEVVNPLGKSVDGIQYGVEKMGVVNVTVERCCWSAAFGGVRIPLQSPIYSWRLLEF